MPPRMEGTEQLKFRIPGELKQQLQTSADNRGRSLNAEIVARLSQSFVRDSAGVNNVELEGLLAIVAAAMNIAGWAAGSLLTFSPQGASEWLSNPIAYEQALKAAVQVLSEAAPKDTKTAKPAPHIADMLADFGPGFANAMLEEAANGTSRVSGMKARAEALRAGISDKLADRLRSGEPREPLVLQAGPGINAVLLQPTRTKSRGEK